MQRKSSNGERNFEALKTKLMCHIARCKKLRQQVASLTLDLQLKTRNPS